VEQPFDILVKKNADTGDTLSLIISTINSYSESEFVKQCAERLCPPGTDRHQCMRNVFDYYCRNVDYILDKPGKEIVGTPTKTIREGKGDCKKAATFLASVLKAAGIEPVLKHVTYADNDSYSHIFTIVPDPDINHYITLDPTNDCRYDSEVRFDGATLYYLDGRVMDLHLMGNPNNGNSRTGDLYTGCCNVMGDLDQVSDNVLNTNSAAPAIKLSQGAKAALSSQPTLPVHQAILADAIKVNPASAMSNRVFVKCKNVPFEQQRGAFLELLKANHLNLATNLLQAWTVAPAPIEDFWKNFGGNPATLKEAILKGASGSVGTVWDDIGRALGSAVPIINAVSNVVTSVVPNSQVATQIQHVATTANGTVNHQIPNYIPTDDTGHRIPTTTTIGSLIFSPVSFVLKGLMTLTVLHLPSVTTSIIATIIIAAPGIAWLIKKYVR